jgi:hypothetical protein
MNIEPCQTCGHPIQVFEKGERVKCVKADPHAACKITPGKIYTVNSIATEYGSYHVHLGNDGWHPPSCFEPVRAKDEPTMPREGLTDADVEAYLVSGFANGAFEDMKGLTDADLKAYLAVYKEAAKLIDPENCQISANDLPWKKSVRNPCGPWLWVREGDLPEATKRSLRDKWRNLKADIPSDLLDELFACGVNNTKALTTVANLLAKGGNFAEVKRGLAKAKRREADPMTAQAIRIASSWLRERERQWLAEQERIQQWLREREQDDRVTA